MECTAYCLSRGKSLDAETLCHRQDEVWGKARGKIVYGLLALTSNPRLSQGQCVTDEQFQRALRKLGFRIIKLSCKPCSTT